MTSVTFVDTSVLCELLGVPGKSDPARQGDVTAEMDRRWRAGERFVIPVTTVIETGNHIAQCDGDRFEIAGRLVRLLRSAAERQGPWLVLQTRLGEEFLGALCAGDSTGKSLEALAAARVGAGDVAVLVERDQLLASSAYTTAAVWTFDADLAAYAGAAR
ncbi:MAG: hypothetical protein ACYC1D_19605 [Acidimicrobiales bacterium]